MAQVIVLDYRHPRIKLLAWLLQDSGLRVEETASIEEAAEQSRDPECRCVIINSAAPEPEVACAVRRLRHAGAEARLAFVTTEHLPAGLPPEPDVCIHTTLDAEELVEQVRRICDEEPA